MDKSYWLSLNDFSSLIQLSVALIIAFTGFPVIIEGLKKRIAKEFVDVFSYLHKHKDIIPIINSQRFKSSLNSKRYHKYLKYSEACSFLLSIDKSKSINKTGEFLLNHNDKIKVLERYANILLVKHKPLMSYIAIYGFIVLLFCGLTSSNGNIFLYKESVQVSHLSYKFFILYTFFALLSVISISSSKLVRNLLFKDNDTSLFANNLFLIIVNLTISGVIIFFAHNYKLYTLQYTLYHGRNFFIVISICLVLLPYPYLYFTSYTLVSYKIYALRFKIIADNKAKGSEFSDSYVALKLSYIINEFWNKPYNRINIIYQIFGSLNEFFKNFKYNRLYKNVFWIYLNSIYKSNKLRFGIMVFSLISISFLIIQLYYKRKIFESDLKLLLLQANKVQFDCFKEVHSSRFDILKKDLLKYYKPTGAAYTDIINLCNKRQSESECLVLDTLQSKYFIDDESIEISKIYTDSIEIITIETWIMAWKNPGCIEPCGVVYESNSRPQKYIISINNDSLMILSNEFKGETRDHRIPPQLNSVVKSSIINSQFQNTYSISRQ